MTIKPNLLFTLCAANPQIMMTKLEFTPAQYKILLQCIQGLTGRQIAETLNVTYGNIRWHKNRMMKVHKTDNMNQLIVIAANVAIEALILKHRREK